MQTNDINLLRSTYLENKKMLDEYKAKKKLYAEKKELYTKLANSSGIRKFELARDYVNGTTLLGFIMEQNGTYDRILNFPNVRSFLDLEKEICSLGLEIGKLEMQLIENKCLFDIKVPAMKIDNCQHELCTMTGILSKGPTSIIRKEALNYETKQTEILGDVGFMSGDFFAYHCLDCNLEKPIAVPIESVPEFESTHKIIYGLSYTPSLLQQRYYELLINHSFDEAYQILKEEIEQGMAYENLKQTIAIRKRELVGAATT